MVTRQCGCRHGCITQLAVVLLTLIVLVIPLFTGEVIGVDQKTGDINEDVMLDIFILAACFTVVRYLS